MNLDPSIRNKKFTVLQLFLIFCLFSPSQLLLLNYLLAYQISGIWTSSLWTRISSTRTGDSSTRPTFGFTCPRHRHRTTKMPGSMSTMSPLIKMTRSSGPRSVSHVPYKPNIFNVCNIWIEIVFFWRQERSTKVKLRSSRGGWVNIDLWDLVSYWFKNPSMNMGLVIEVTTNTGAKLQVGVKHQPSQVIKDGTG